MQYLRAYLPTLMLLIPSIVISAPTIESIVDKLQRGDYSEAHRLLIDYRKGIDGRRWYVDYFTGVAMCNKTPPDTLGTEYIKSALRYKDISVGDRNEVIKVLASCTLNGGSNTIRGPSYEMTPMPVQFENQSASISGKGGYNFYQKNPELATNKTAHSNFTASELEARKLPIGNEEKASHEAVQRLKGQFNAMELTAIRGYAGVCIKSEGGCDGIMTTALRCLQQFEQPLISQFDMVRPPSILSVYIPPELRFIPTFAQKLHGTTLPHGTVAYSVYEDLSIVGLYIQGCGTLAHELVHLMIRGNFGDAPAWLEEGLASAVAVGGISSPNKIKFGPSWRDDALRKNISHRPTVPELLKLDWSAFSADDPTKVKRVAAVHAMAAVYIRYLDSKGALQDVYKSIRESRSSPETIGTCSDECIVSRALGIDSKDLDRRFVEWFRPNPNKAGQKKTAQK